MTFCTAYDLGPVPQWCKNSKTQGWLKAWLDENWLEESVYGKYNLFLDQINYFLEKKGHGNPRHTYAHECSRSACVCFMHAYAYTCMRAYVCVC